MPAPVPSPFLPEHPTPVALADLAARFGFAGDPGAAEVTGISLGTAAVRPGDLFVALQGVRLHGADYAAQAVAAGAVAILTDDAGRDRAEAAGVTVVTTPQPRAVLGDLAAALYRTRDDHPLLLGVTGTNGKTSTVHLLAGLLDLMGVPGGLSSTAERRVGADRRVAGLTTPEATELHALVARMREAGVEAAAVEVSAQGLSRHRLDGVRFDVAGFTNLSHDHLDDYADMEEYYRAKAVLFQPDRAARAVVSLDTPWGARVVADAGIPVTTIVQGPGEADWRVEVVEETQAHTAFTLVGPAGTITTRIPVLGAHMAANAGLAIVMLLDAGYPFERVRAAVEGPRGMAVTLPGRTELVSGPGAPAVYVDFGHSPHAFQETLAAVRAVTPGRVVMLFGADGDRDATKRADMSRAAVAGSDVLVITDHHPRFEDPASIRATLLAAAREAAPDHPLYEEGQPERAIRLALSLVQPGDAILWAGPGHQNYRDIRGVRTDYSARREARAALREAGYEAAESHDLQR